MRFNAAKQVSVTGGADTYQFRGAWLTVTWQLAVVVLVAVVLGLSCNQVRTTGLPLIGNWSPEAQLTMESGDSLAVSLADAEGMYYAHSAIFLDARSPELYHEGHIKSALNLPWEGGDTRFVETLRDFPVETIFITYCDGEGCSLSRELAMAMLDRGYNEVRVLVNGWTLWQAGNLPVESGMTASSVR